MKLKIFKIFIIIEFNIIKNIIMIIIKIMINMKNIIEI